MKTAVATTNNSPEILQECANWLRDYLEQYHPGAMLKTDERMHLEYQTDLCRYTLFFFTREEYVHFYMTEIGQYSSILSFPMPRYERDFVKIMQILDIK